MKNKVAVSNDIINCFIKNNNLVTLKLLFYISSTTYQQKENILKFTYKTTSILKDCNISLLTLKRNLRQSTKTTIKINEEDRETYISVFPKISVFYGVDVTEITVFKEVLDLILEVKRKFTIIDINNLMRLNNKHSLKMIQILENINGFDKHIPKRRVLTLEELNGLFDTNYKRLITFKKEVLDKIQLELDEKSKLSFVSTFEYSQKPIRGRPKIISIVVDLINNNPQPSLF